MKTLEQLQEVFPKLDFNNTYKNIIDLLHNNEQNFINIIGNAGSGKSTLLNVIKNMLWDYNVVVCSTTGVSSALLNSSYSDIKATTLHSALKLPIQDIYGSNLPRISSETSSLIEAMDYFIIDEVSMLNASLFDYIFELLSYVRAQYGLSLPKIILFGDILQLTPVVKNDEDVKNFYKEYYKGNIFYFNSRYFNDKEFVTFELNKIYRQEGDESFKDILNKIRVGEHSQKDLDIINSRVMPEEDWVLDHDKYLSICTTNKEVATQNEVSLEMIDNPFIDLTATIKGDFRDSPEFKSGNYPEEIRVKIGCPVMITRNDIGEYRQYVNGDMGILIDYDANDKIATIEIGEGEETRRVQVPEFITNIYEYTVNKVENEDKKISAIVEPSIKGSYQNIAIKPCSALTIHKTQGLTISKGFIDKGYWQPENGIYVALSRFRKLEDFGLKKPITMKDIKINKEALQFLKKLNHKRE